MIFVTYLRISMDRQGKSGLGLEAQRAAVADHVEGKGKIAAEYVEIESGMKNERRPRPTGASAIAGSRRFIQPTGSRSPRRRRRADAVPRVLHKGFGGDTMDRF